VSVGQSYRERPPAAGLAHALSCTWHQTVAADAAPY